MSQSPDTEKQERAGSFRFTRSIWSAPLLGFLFVAVLRLFFTDTIDRLEFSWYDEALQLREEKGFYRPLDDRIKFVELGMTDEIARRFAEDGEYATAAGVIDTISKLGASVIALDIVYAYGRKEDQELLAAKVREINERGGTRIVVPAIIEEDLEEGGSHLLESIPLVEGEKFLRGIVNVSIDSDHIWRRYRDVHTVDGETIPSLAFAAYSASLPKAFSPKPVPDQPGVMSWKESGDDGIQTFSVNGSEYFLNLQHSYYRKETGRKFKLHQLEALAETGNVSLFHDSIVFFGYGAEFDGKPTPHGPQQPGMVLHGTALNDLFNDTRIHRFPFWAELLIFFGTAFVAAIGFRNVKKKVILTAGVLLGLIVIGLGGWMLIWFACIFPPTIGAAIVWGLSVFGEVGRRWAHEQRERTQRDAMLGFYFSPAVLKQVTQDLDMIRPQGNEVAILLSDLRGFTTLCETQKVERVFELLNRLFGVETEEALKEDGSLARFAGDQFLAYWGAPESCSDAASRALRAALNIQKTLISRREAADEDDLDSWLKIGVGLHFGRGLVGHVGSRDYRDYNIVGDSVNTTARVEGQTKNYGAPVLATGEFIDALDEPVDALMVDHVRVKGRHKAVKLFAVPIPEREPSAHQVEAYRAAFSLYESGAFTAAADSFEALKDSAHPTVSVSASLLQERCNLFATTPPDDWDGVFVLIGK